MRKVCVSQADFERMLLVRVRDMLTNKRVFVAQYETCAQQIHLIAGLIFGYGYPSYSSGVKKTQNWQKISENFLGIAKIFL